MPAVVKIQTVETLSHVSKLCDYLGDSSHPRHCDIVISDRIGLNCSSKAEFLQAIQAAESRRVARKKELLSAKALHLMGGTTSGLLLKPDERCDVLKALLAQLPTGLPVIAVFHELRTEDCEDFHIVISGYNAVANDSAFRFATGIHPISYVRRQLDLAVAKIESARSGGNQPKMSSSSWQLNRKRKPKSLSEQIAAASEGSGSEVSEIIQKKLHFPIVGEQPNSFSVMTWYQVRPQSVSKNWKAQPEFSRKPESEILHGLVEPADLQKAEDLNVL